MSNFYKFGLALILAIIFIISFVFLGFFENINSSTEPIDFFIKVVIACFLVVVIFIIILLSIKYYFIPREKRKNKNINS